MFCLEKSRSGLETLKYNNKYIHSKYDPISEANMFAKSNIKENENDIIVVYGLGLGYHIKALVDLISENSVIYVFEYNQELVKCCRRVNKDVFMDRRVKIIDKNNLNFFDEFAKVLSKVKNIIIHKSSLETIKYTSSFMYNLINDFNIAKQYEKINIEIIGQYEKNYEFNKKLKYGLLKSLIKNYNRSNKPFIIVASGPSLENELSLLTKYRKKFNIICVGSAFRTLIENNIIPDIVVIIDPNEMVINQLKKLDCNNVPLCFSASASRWAVEFYRGPKYIFNRENDEFYIETGGTVAVAAIGIAIEMSALEIILMGQDLAFIGDRSHTLAFEKNYGLKDDFYNNLKRKKIKGINGENIETTQIYITFKNKIETVIRKNRKIRFFNVSKGAIIEGADNIEFKKYLEKYII